MSGTCNNALLMLRDAIGTPRHHEIALTIVDEISRLPTAADIDADGSISMKDLTDFADLCQCFLSNSRDIRNIVNPAAERNMFKKLSDLRNASQKEIQARTTPRTTKNCKSSRRSWWSGSSILGVTIMTFALGGLFIGGVGASLAKKKTA
jgi:hypothetical protein